MGNKTWKGKIAGELTVPAQISAQGIKVCMDVADKVDGIGKKHAIDLIAELRRAGTLPTGGPRIHQKGQNMECPDRAPSK